MAAAAGGIDHQLHDGARRGAVGFGAWIGAQVRRPVRAVPAVAEPHSHRVAALLQQAGHVVAAVQHAVLQLRLLVVVVEGGRRVEHALAHPGAVEVQLVEAETGNVGPRPRHRSGHRKLLAQQRRGDGGIGRADPGRRPVGGLQQPHLEPRRLAPRSGVAGLVPHLHRPPAAFAAGQRASAKGHVGGTRLLHPATVPDAAGAGFQFLRRGSHQDPVGALRPTTLRRRPGGRFNLPGEPRNSHVDPQRIDQVLAAQVSGAQRRVRARGGGGGKTQDPASVSPGTARTPPGRIARVCRSHFRSVKLVYGRQPHGRRGGAGRRATWRLMALCTVRVPLHR